MPDTGPGRHPRRPDPEEALRRHLGQAAGAVDPGPAPRVRELLDAAPPRRWPAATAVAASVALLAVATAVTARPGDEPVGVASPSVQPRPTVTVTETVPVPTSAPAPTGAGEPTAPPATSEPPTTAGPDDGTSDAPAVVTTTVTADPSPTATGTTGAPVAGPTTVVVWFTREQERRDGVQLRLVPERVPVTVPAGTDLDGEAGPALLALERLLGADAGDPDHANPWVAGGRPAGSPVRGLSAGASGTTVDLDGAAFDAGLGTEAAGLALQALARTVVSNGLPGPVSVTVDGRAGAEVWGAFVLDRPLETPTGSLVGGWVLDPWEGQRVRAGSLTVSGTATAFEGTVQWRLRDSSGAVVDSGFTSAGANGAYGPFTFTTDVRPGTWTVEVLEESAAGPDEGVPVVWQHTTRITAVG